MKQSKGITLIALIITIIVLLILATISIQELTNTGLIKKADNAKENMEKAEIEQGIKLNEYEDQLNYYMHENKSDKKLVTEIKINQENATLKVGDTLNLSVTVLPEDADNKDVKWTSSNEKIATVDDNGKVTAISGGTAIITAKATDGSEAYGTCEIVVDEELVLFDYKSGGLKYELEKIDTGYHAPVITSTYVTGPCNGAGCRLEPMEDKANI